MADTAFTGDHRKFKDEDFAHPEDRICAAIKPLFPHGRFTIMTYRTEGMAAKHVITIEPEAFSHD